MFFFLLVLAGLTSGIGYLEAVASTLADLFRMSRKTSTGFYADVDLHSGRSVHFVPGTLEGRDDFWPELF